MAGSQPRFDQVSAPQSGNTIADFLVVFPAPAIALVGTAEADETADVNSRARLVVGAQRDPACRKLEAEIVHRPGARDRRKRARQPLVFREGVAARAGVTERSGVESISRYSVVGVGIAQHQRVSVTEVMIELP